MLFSPIDLSQSRVGSEIANSGKKKEYSAGGQEHFSGNRVGPSEIGWDFHKIVHRINICIKNIRKLLKYQTFKIIINLFIFSLIFKIQNLLRWVSIKANNRTALSIFRSSRAITLVSSSMLPRKYPSLPPYWVTSFN